MLLSSYSRAVTFVGWSLLLVLFLALSNTAPVYAGGTVNDCLTDNDLTNKLVGGGTVTFQCPTSTIPWSGTKTIAANTTIDGDNKITFSGGFGYRLFIVNSGVTLTLRNLTLINGYNPNSAGGAAVSNNGHLILENVTVHTMADSSFNGGGIATYGALEITNSRFHDNKATNGGAIFASGASAVVTIQSSNFYSNKATGTTADVNGFGGAIYGMNSATVNLSTTNVYGNSASSGGGIYVGSNAVLSVSRSRIHHNSAAAKGSGILNSATATLTEATIDGNTGVGTSLGGGIYNYGTLTVTGVTLNNNSAYYGGGMSNAFSTANLTNVTVSGNSAVAYGGGIDNIAATLYLTNVTVGYNSANSGGGGILNEGLANTKLYLKNVIVSHNKTGGNCFFQTGPLLSDHNLSSDATCNFGVGRDSAKLKLGPLETNGGPTLTHRLQPGSAGIDSGVFVNTILTDQRATTRPRGTAFDGGAFEFIPCAGTPPKPQRLSPGNDAQVLTQQVVLDWAGPDCVKKFSVVVRQDTKTGPIVFTKSKFKPTQVTTTTLAKNHTYFWRVTACLGLNCVNSKWGKFHID